MKRKSSNKSIRKSKRDQTAIRKALQSPQPQKGIQLALDACHEYRSNKYKGDLKELMSDLYEAIQVNYEVQDHEKSIEIFETYKELTTHCRNPIENLFFCSIQNLFSHLYLYYKGVSTREDISACIRYSESIHRYSLITRKVESQLYGYYISGKELIRQNKHCHYLISVQLAFSIPIENGVYKACDGIEEIFVHTSKSKDKTSKLDDRYFTTIHFKFKGVARIPDIDDETIEKMVNTINAAVINIKAHNKEIAVKFVNESDISGNITIKQLDCNNHCFRKASGIIANKFLIQDLISFNPIEDREIFYSAVDDSPIYRNLYTQALCQLQEGSYTSCYYTINSAVESLIDYYCKKVLDGSEQAEDSYELFMLGNESECSVCGPKTMPPSAFAQITKIMQVSKTDKAKQKEITNHSFINLLTQVKSPNGKNSLRNDLTHGRLTSVRKADAKTALESFEKLEYGFMALHSL